ncbi:hypothetical protein ACFWY9_00395 [Amycolatopsis sp. NPDC059027]|uniref:hypothetical protein n=1 Tax=Amycolatopsis sp. NPDC059027 TaxID=3346709 RepID=UPI00366C8760
MTHPQQPVPYPGQARPSGGTAITAAVLALVAFLLDGYFVVRGLGDVRYYDLPGLIGYLHLIPTVLLLLVGSILVFARVKAGAVLLLIGAGLDVLAWVAVAALTGGESLNYLELLAYAPLIGIVDLLGLLIAVAVVILAALPPTRRYLSASRQPIQHGPPVPYGYPPSQGYDPPPHPGQHPPQQW